MRVKLEKVTGVVALSYLVLIPAAAYYGYRRIMAIEEDLATLWDKAEMSDRDKAEVIGFPTLRERIRRGFNVSS